MDNDDITEAFRYGLSLWPFAVAVIAGSAAAVWGAAGAVPLLMGEFLGPTVMLVFAVCKALLLVVGGGIVAFAGCYGALYRMWADFERE